MPSWKTTFSQIRVTYRHFGDSPNPPILHRKELFVPDHHPTRDKFSRLSGQEERAGLLDRKADNLRANTAISLTPT